MQSRPRAAPFGDSWHTMPCVPGGIGRGSFLGIRTSSSWLVRYSTCTTVTGRASHSGRTSTCCASDEKTSIQVRRRRHPTLPLGPFQATRVEHEYERGGALQYLAAWDVHRAVVFGRCEPKTGKAAFGRLVDDVMSQE